MDAMWQPNAMRMPEPTRAAGPPRRIADGATHMHAAGMSIRLAASTGWHGQHGVDPWTSRLAAGQHGTGSRAQAAGHGQQPELRGLRPGHTQKKPPTAPHTHATMSDQLSGEPSPLPMCESCEALLNGSMSTEIGHVCSHEL